MRWLTTVLALGALGVAGFVADKPVAAGQTVDLLAGDSLDGWGSFLADSSVKPEDVWSLKDGVLACKGQPFGYLYTKRAYRNFKLSVEWRWPPGTKPGNSGVLLRISGDAVSFLPKCAEAQLMGGHAGDIWGFYGYSLQGDPARMRKIENHTQLGTFIGVGLIKANEREPGEWNKYEITFEQDRLTLVVNGQKVNEATNCEILDGPIGLQSEGSEIQFRNVRLTELP